MKYLKYFIAITFPVLFASCEVTTVKGTWVSEKFDDGYFFKMLFLDDEFTIYKMDTDSTYSNKMFGSWVENGDTISLYSQKEGNTIFVIEQLTQNNMTIYVDNQYLIMERTHPIEFMDILELKGGFWWYVYIIGVIGTGCFLMAGIYDAILGLANWIVKLIRKCL